MISKHKDIVVDLDDVIGDMCTMFETSLNRLTNTNISSNDWDDFNLKKHYPSLTDDQIHNLIIDDKLMENMQPINSAINGLSMIKESGYHAHIVTARGFHPDAYDVTKTWLDNHNIPHASLTVCKYGQSKSDSYKDIADNFAFMIDDHIGNIEDAAKSGIVDFPIIITKPWNLRHTTYEHGVNRFNSLGEFCRRIS